MISCMIFVNFNTERYRMHECTSIPSILRHVRHMAHGHLQCTRQSHFHIYSQPHLYKAINAAGAIPAMPTAQCRCGVYRNVITTNATSDGATALTLQMTRPAQWITVHRMTTMISHTLLLTVLIPYIGSAFFKTIP